MLVRFLEMAPKRSHVRVKADLASTSTRAAKGPVLVITLPATPLECLPRSSSADDRGPRKRVGGSPCRFMQGCLELLPLYSVSVCRRHSPPAMSGKAPGNSRSTAG